MTTRYAVIGLPPSSAGAVHFTVSEVAWTSEAEDVMAGEGGSSNDNQMKKNSIDIIYISILF